MNNEIWPEDTSKRVKTMNDKIDDCLRRVAHSKRDSTTVQLTDIDNVKIQREGLI